MISYSLLHITGRIHTTAAYFCKMLVKVSMKCGRSLLPRRHTVTSALPERRVANKPVFQMYPPHGDVSLEEAREAFELCSNFADPAERDACYCIFGMDGEAVENCLPSVEYLERAYKKYPAPPLYLKKKPYPKKKQPKKE